MRVGFLTASISRQAGGILWATQPLAHYLGEFFCEVQVFAGRDSYTENDLGEWGGVNLNILNRIGPVKFGYLPDLQKELSSADLDVVHTHGLWMYSSIAARRWGRRTGKPWIVSPHGMLDPWALRNARWKKQFSGLLYENSHLRGAACLHALSVAEAAAFRDLGLTNPIAVVPNGVDLPKLSVTVSPPQWSRELNANSRVLLFLGRLHPKKGLLNLLRAWAQQRQMTSEPWVLVIAGWDQNNHQEELKSMVSDLGIATSVRFIGPQFKEQKVASLIHANAFVLPSFSEGLPMAVLEAWSYGLPVVMTPQCNLPEGYSARAAIEAEPDVASLRDALQILFNMSDKQLHEMGACGRALVAEQFTWLHLSEKMLSVYRWVSGYRDIPECVILD